jgi:hypothetical protein
MTLYTNKTAEELATIAETNYDYELSTWLANNRGTCTLKNQIYSRKTIQFWNDNNITHKGAK